ncbi:hypothetical protein [Nocardioides marmoraquaticus]
MLGLALRLQLGARTLVDPATTLLVEEAVSSLRAAPAGNRRVDHDNLTADLTTIGQEFASSLGVAARCRISAIPALTCSYAIECIPRQQLEISPRRPGGQGVAGSNPVSPTEEPQVRGSFTAQR